MAIRSASRESLVKVETVAQLVSASVVGVSFWIAVLLPFIQLLVLASGIDGQSDFVLFGGLVVLNAIALIGGKDYRAGQLKRTY